MSEGEYGGTLRLFVSSDATDWDVHQSGSLNTTQKPSGRRFNQLVEYDPVNPTQIIGDLAQDWSVGPDGKTYTFKLYDVDWSDGTPLTAEDIVFSLDRMVEPGERRGRAGALRAFYEHGTARAIDEKTVEVPAKFPTPSLPAWLAADPMKILPKHAIEGKTQDEISSGPADLPSSSGWVFKEWSRGNFWEYERNPNYFKEGLPFLDAMRTFIIGDATRALAALRTNQVDGSDGIYGLNPTDLQELEAETNGTVIMLLWGGVVDDLIIDWTRPPFDDARVRRALFLGIDRKEMLDVVRKGFGDLGGFFIPGTVSAEEGFWQWPGFRYVDAAGNVVQNAAERTDVQKDPRDIDEARRLIREAGYEGFQGELVAPRVAGWDKNSEVLRQQFQRNLGWDITVRAGDLAFLYSEIGANRANLYAIGQAPLIPLPESMLSTAYLEAATDNYYGYQNDRLEDVAAELARAADPAKRDQLLEQIISILQEGENPFVPLYWQATAGAITAHVKNFVLPPTSQIVLKNEHLWIDPDAKP